MRIKAEGDYDAIKALVNQYGVHDRTVRREIAAAVAQQIVLELRDVEARGRFDPRDAHDTQVPERVEEHHDRGNAGYAHPRSPLQRL